MSPGTFPCYTGRGWGSGPDSSGVRETLTTKTGPTPTDTEKTSHKPVTLLDTERRNSSLFGPDLPSRKGRPTHYPSSAVRDSESGTSEVLLPTRQSTVVWPLPDQEVSRRRPPSPRDDQRKERLWEGVGPRPVLIDLSWKDGLPTLHDPTRVPGPVCTFEPRTSGPCTDGYRRMVGPNETLRRRGSGGGPEEVK